MSQEGLRCDALVSACARCSVWAAGRWRTWQEACDNALRGWTCCHNVFHLPRLLRWSSAGCDGTTTARGCRRCWLCPGEAQSATLAGSRWFLSFSDNGGLIWAMQVGRWERRRRRFSTIPPLLTPVLSAEESLTHNKGTWKLEFIPNFRVRHRCAGIIGKIYEYMMKRRDYKGSRLCSMFHFNWGLVEEGGSYLPRWGVFKCYFCLWFGILNLDVCVICDDCSDAVLESLTMTSLQTDMSLVVISVCFNHRRFLSSS